MEQSEPREAASWWGKAPQADPPPVDADEVEASNSSETTTIFRNALMQYVACQCAATGRKLERHEASTHTKLAAVRCIEASTGHEIYNRLARQAFDLKDSRSWKRECRCRPLFSGAHASSVGMLDNAHWNGIVRRVRLSCMTQFEFSTEMLSLRWVLGVPCVASLELTTSSTAGHANGLARVGMLQATLPFSGVSRCGRREGRSAQSCREVGRAASIHHFQV